MLNRKGIEKTRSPHGLRQFVRFRMEKVRQVARGMIGRP
jgi:hypothetical protein